MTTEHDVSFLSDENIWPSDKLRRLAVHLASGRPVNINEIEILVSEIYDIEERWAKIVWMERQTNRILVQLKESGVTIPMAMLERLPAFRPDNRRGENAELVS